MHVTEIYIFIRSAQRFQGADDQLLFTSRAEHTEEKKKKITPFLNKHIYK